MLKHTSPRIESDQYVLFAHRADLFLRFLFSCFQYINLGKNSVSGHFWSFILLSQYPEFLQVIMVMLVFTHNIYFRQVEHQLPNKSHFSKFCSAFGGHLPSVQCYWQLLLYWTLNMLLSTCAGPEFPLGSSSVSPPNAIRCNWKAANYMLIKPVYVILLQWQVWRGEFLS